MVARMVVNGPANVAHDLCKMLNHVGVNVRHGNGAIVLPNFPPRLAIVTKFVDQFPFHQLLRAGGCKILDSWLARLDHTKPWMICMKVSRRGWFTIMADHGHDQTLCRYQYHSRHGRIHIAEFHEFFRAIPQPSDENAPGDAPKMILTSIP